MSDKCHKYIMQDMQEACFVDYIITDRYFSSEAACRRAWAISLAEHTVKYVGPWLLSEQTGDIAWSLTRHER